MSCHAVAARSSLAPLTAILNLRGRNANSGCSVLHWRRISQYGRGSTISSAATPAKQSLVMFLMQLPLVWMPCMSTSASTSITSAASAQGDPVELAVLARREVAEAAAAARTGRRRGRRTRARCGPARAAASSSARRTARRCAPSARGAARTSRSAGAAPGSRRRAAVRRDGARAGRGTAPRAGARSRVSNSSYRYMRSALSARRWSGAGPESEARAAHRPLRDGKAATVPGADARPANHIFVRLRIPMRHKEIAPAGRGDAPVAAERRACARPARAGGGLGALGAGRLREHASRRSPRHACGCAVAVATAAPCRRPSSSRRRRAGRASAWRSAAARRAASPTSA